MKATFRATTPDDRVAIAKLLEGAFDNNPASGLLDPAVLAWKYWDRREDWDEPRAYVLEREGRITAHAGIWPVTFPGTEQVRGIQMIDWCAAKESPGAGLAIVQRLAAQFDFIYSIGGSEQTRRVLPGLGFIEAARAWTAARPLRPLRQALTHQAVNWKLAPRLLRNWMWSKGPAADARGWRTQELNPSEIPWEAIRGSEPACNPRPPAFFEYLQRCPRIRYQIYGIVNGEAVEGYFALGVLRGQARVAGVWLRNPNQKGWRIAYTLARQAALRLPEAYEIAAMGSMGPSGEAAAEAGLRVMRTTPVFLLNKKGRFKLPENFQFQLSDDDAAFLDLGQASYYT